MRMVDLLAKKRHGGVLSDEEIQFFVREYTAGNIPDYQASALTMAICLTGMNEQETTALTLAMAYSGDTVDLSSIAGIKVDKHSTGGVGDKTSLIVGPIVASCGVPVAKMSGRGLGHTGGTIDKLESIPGLRTALGREEFLDIVRRAGISIAGQTGNLAPADKKLYALRDVTSTVDSIPLIASSIMSKKIAAGADAIVLDVKTGSGAFCKTVDEAEQLARMMVRIGSLAGRETVALITEMDIPLGNAVGNSLEVIEAAETLRANGPSDLTAVCIELAANMLMLAGKGSLDTCRALAEQTIRSGAAFTKLQELVAAQGGDIRCLDDSSLFAQPALCREVYAPKSGYIAHMDSERIGVASMLLGAGRTKKDDCIDYSAGIVLLRKTGDYVQAGEPLAQLYTSNAARATESEPVFLAALQFGDIPPHKRARILSRIDH